MSLPEDMEQLPIDAVLYRYLSNFHSKTYMPLKLSSRKMFTEEHNVVNDLSLHHCVFEGDLMKLSQLLRCCDISKKDKHECTHLLLAHGAPVKVKNLHGWSPLAEAISYGDRQTISSLLRKLKMQAREQMEVRRPKLTDALEKIDDFFMELKWDFQSWANVIEVIKFAWTQCDHNKKRRTLCHQTSYFRHLFTKSNRQSHQVPYEPRQLISVKRPAAAYEWFTLQQKDIASEFMLEAYSTDVTRRRRSEISDEIPLVSKMLPSDKCRIHKRGSMIRLDTTLVDFSDMRWERGDISFIFHGDKPSQEALTVLDNEFQRFQRCRYEDNESDIENEVDILMSSDILAAQISTTKISFSKAQSGWFFRSDKKEIVAGQYNCELYYVNGLLLESRKRREHLSKDDLIKNKAVMESLSKGHSTEIEEVVRRASLLPPPESLVTWDEYMNCSPGENPKLGRQLVYKESNKAFRATVAMSQNFPVSVDMLLNILEVLAPFKHFSQLREFITLKLPSGFPVKLEIPVLPTVSAKITFQKFEFRKDIAADIFEIPDHYIEDSKRFPEL